MDDFLLGAKPQAEQLNIDSLQIAVNCLNSTIIHFEGFLCVFFGFFACVTCGLYLIKSNFKGY